MKKFLISAAAMSMFVPGAVMAAADGSPGATSTGSFSATMNVEPPSGVTVQVIGLDDFDFGTVYTSNTAGTSVGPVGQTFCLLRSDAGDVRVNIVQTNIPAGQSFTLMGTLDVNADAVTDNIPLNIVIYNPSIGGGTAMSNNVPQNIPQSLAGCSVASGGADGHGLSITPTTLPSADTLALSGAYTAQFTMTVSVP